jgi:hypothetical protein
MKNFFCYIGIHNWKAKKEKHRVLNHEHGRDCIRIVVRECSSCGKRESLIKNHWKNCDFQENSTINLKDKN